jgi:hypothetical protein
MKQYNIFGGIDDVEAQTTRADIFNDYEGFKEKFKAKKTTDDCYTPPAVYAAVLGFCKDMGFVNDSTEVVRPFFPGGDFERHYYPEGCVVVDNPPFSIYAKVVRWFVAHGVRFFLFGPQLTLKVKGADVCYLPVNASITYDNGAVVNTGFVTNMLQGVRIWTAPPLVRALKAAAPAPKLTPKNTYPTNVLSPALIGKIAVREVDFIVRSDQCQEIQNLDSLKRAGKSLFGGGWLLSERAAAERAAAERAAAERAAGTCVQLSAEEQTIVDRLTAHDTD